MRSFLSLGFRPFYLLAALFAVAGLGFWLLSYLAVVDSGGYLRGVFWHNHEMVFGFAVAVISGFLLTAVRNWTGLPTPTGLLLAALAAVWLLGRVLIVTGPSMVAAFVDVLYLPLLLVAISLPIIRSRNRRNYKVIVLLALIAFTHGVFHYASLGPAPAWLAYTTIIVALDLITILYAIVAGRVIPAFTRNAVPGAEPRASQWVELVVFAAMISIVAARVASDWVAVPMLLPTALLVVAAVAHAFRLALWQPQVTVTNPLLWMLPVSYSWLPVAFFLRGLAGHAIVMQATWIHALAAGAISSLMLAMMMRSSLGHTGRGLVASRLDMTAFLLLQAAAIVRVTAGLFDGAYASVVTLAGILWMLAFGIFFLRYLPMLTQPRADGRAG